MRRRGEQTITRRQALVAAAGGAAAATLGVSGAVMSSVGAAGCATNQEPSSHGGPATPGSPGDRLPVVFLPHGGGPWPFVDTPFGSKEELSALTAYIKSVKSVTQKPVRAILAVSAHWEEPVFTVMSGEKPPLLFDYYGFPPESYELTWPAPGHPIVAARVRELLEKAGFPTAENKERGFDHGTFVPLKLAYPEADVPCVQLSLKRGLDPATHIAMGRALAPLRDEGVLIIGSGMSYHNLRAFGPAGRAPSEAFDKWLNEAATASPEERASRLTEWSKAPSARAVHPREEHLLPLMVVAGAAGSDIGRTAYNGTLLGLRLSAHHFG